MREKKKSVFVTLQQINKTPADVFEHNLHKLVEPAATAAAPVRARLASYISHVYFSLYLYIKDKSGYSGERGHRRGGGRGRRRQRRYLPNQWTDLNECRSHLSPAALMTSLK